MIDPKDKKEGDPFDDVELISSDEDEEAPHDEPKPGSDESGDEQEDPQGPDESGEEDPEEDGEDAPPRGTRAQKRIRQLIQQRRTAEIAAAQLAERLRSMEEKLAERERALEDSQRVSVEEAENRLNAEEKALEAAFLDADEEGDRSKMLAIQKKLAAIEVARGRISDWKAAQPKKPEGDDEKPKGSEPKKPKTWVNDQDRTNVLTWVERNKDWFQKDTDPMARAATKLAFEINEELRAEGFDPAEAPSAGNKLPDFYIELDKRLHKALPGFFEKTRKGKQTMGSGQRTEPGRKPAGSSKIALTRRELELVQRLGITPQQYDEQRKKLASSSGGR